MISLVTFRRPFRLAGIAEEQKEGTYLVRRAQGTADMMTAAGWWRTPATIEVGQNGAFAQVAISGLELRDALMRDGEDNR